MQGNYTEGVLKSGIFVKTLNRPGKPSATQVIAMSDTLNPGQLAGGLHLFGSTPPLPAPATIAGQGQRS